VPKTKIIIDTQQAQIALDKLKKNLSATGLESLKSEKEFKKLEERLMKGLRADKARLGQEELQKSLNLTKKEFLGLQIKSGNWSGALKTVESMTGRVTKSVLSLKSAFLTLGVGFVFRKMLNDFATFETKLIDMGRVTKREFGLLEKDIKALPTELGSWSNLMSGYYQVISAGVKGTANQIDVLTEASKLAKSSHIEQAETIKGLTKLMEGYEGEIKSTSEAADLLNKTEQEGQTTVAELIPVVGGLAKVSHDLGVSADEMGAGLAVISKTAGDTSEAATRYRAVLVSLMRENENMSKAMDELGYKDAKLMISQFGLIGTLQRLENTATAADLGLMKLYGRQEAMIGASALLARKGKTFNDSLEVMKEKTGAAEQAWNDYRKSFQASKDEMKDIISNLGVSLGEDLAKPVREFNRDLKLFIEENKDDLSDMVKDIGSIGKDLVGIFGAAVSGFGKLPKIIQEMGIFGAMAFGWKGLAVVTAISLIVDLVKDLTDVKKIQEYAEQMEAYRTGKAIVPKEGEKGYSWLEKPPPPKYEAKNPPAEGATVPKIVPLSSRNKPIVIAEQPELTIKKDNIQNVRNEALEYYNIHKDVIDEILREMKNFQEEQEKIVLGNYDFQFKQLDLWKDELVKAGKWTTDTEMIFHNKRVELSRKEFEEKVKNERAYRKETENNLKKEAKPYESATEARIKIKKEIREKLLSDYDKEIEAAEIWKIQMIGAVNQYGIATKQNLDDIEKAYQKMLKKAKEDTKEKTKEMSEYAKEAARNIQDAFSDVFYDVFRGDLKSFKDYWNAFCDAMYRTWANMIAKMIAEKLFFENANSATSSNNTGQLILDLGSTILDTGTDTGGGAGESSEVFAKANSLFLNSVLDRLEKDKQKEVLSLSKIPRLDGLSLAGLKNNEGRVGNYTEVKEYFLIQAVDSDSFAGVVQRNPNSIKKVVFDDLTNKGLLTKAIKDLR